MDYMVKMDGMKVRMFHNRDYDDVLDWAEAHCRGNFKIVKYVECRGLPRAYKPIKPNLDMPNLVYKPFVSLG